jgi:hypothetical protein
MHSLISVNTSYTDAVKTFENLKDAGYSNDQLTLVNREEIINNHISINHDARIETIETTVCAGLGLLFGVLLSTGIVHFKGANFAHFSGFIVALCMGLIAGCFLGGLVSLATFAALQWKLNTQHQNLLQNGDYLIFINGTESEINNAEKIAHTEGLHWQFS